MIKELADKTGRVKKAAGKPPHEKVPTTPAEPPTKAVVKRGKGLHRLVQSSAIEKAKDKVKSVAKAATQPMTQAEEKANEAREEKAAKLAKEQEKISKAYGDKRMGGDAKDALRQRLQRKLSVKARNG